MTLKTAESACFCPCVAHSPSCTSLLLVRKGSLCIGFSFGCLMSLDCRLHLNQGLIMLLRPWDSASPSLSCSYSFSPKARCDWKWKNTTFEKSFHPFLKSLHGLTRTFIFTLLFFCVCVCIFETTSPHVRPS